MKMIFHSILFPILFLISSSFTEQKAIPINIFFEPHFSCFLIFSQISSLPFPFSESALKEAKVNSRQKSWKFDEAKCEEALFHAIQLITDFYETWLRKFQDEKLEDMCTFGEWSPFLRENPSTEAFRRKREKLKEIHHPPSQKTFLIYAHYRRRNGSENEKSLSFDLFLPGF